MLFTREEICIKDGDRCRHAEFCDHCDQLVTECDESDINYLKGTCNGYEPQRRKKMKKKLYKVEANVVSIFVSSEDKTELYANEALAEELHGTKAKITEVVDESQVPSYWLEAIPWGDTDDDTIVENIIIKNRKITKEEMITEISEKIKDLDEKKLRDIYLTAMKKKEDDE